MGVSGVALTREKHEDVLYEERIFGPRSPIERNLGVSRGLDVFERRFTIPGMEWIW